MIDSMEKWLFGRLEWHVARWCCLMRRLCSPPERWRRIPEFGRGQGTTNQEEENGNWRTMQRVKPGGEKRKHALTQVWQMVPSVSMCSRPIVCIYNIFPSRLFLFSSCLFPRFSTSFSNVVDADQLNACSNFLNTYWFNNQSDLFPIIWQPVSKAWLF